MCPNWQSKSARCRFRPGKSNWKLAYGNSFNISNLVQWTRSDTCLVRKEVTRSEKVWLEKVKWNKLFNLKLSVQGTFECESRSGLWSTQFSQWFDQKWLRIMEELNSIIRNRADFTLWETIKVQIFLCDRLITSCNDFRYEKDESSNIELTTKQVR